MPEPFAKDLLHELVENGILKRYRTTLEFMHESVRDYFAAIEVSEWPVEEVLRNVSPLVWRHVQPINDELPVGKRLEQAVIMSSGLRKDYTAEFLQRLFDHHPLLAAHCLAGASDIALYLKENLLKLWLELLDRRLSRYRWVGVQCLGAAKVRSTKVARRLAEVVCNDSDWWIRRAAARALAAINDNDTQVMKDLVAQAVKGNPGDDYLSRNALGGCFSDLQTDTLIVEMLKFWGNSTQTDARKRRVEELFCQMRRSSVREALERLVDQAGGGKAGENEISHLARSALDLLESWRESWQKSRVLPISPEELDNIRRRIETDTRKWQEEMTNWPRANLISALKDSPEKCAAAARSMAARKIEAIPELLDALARDHSWATGDLLEALRALDTPEVLYAEWQMRIRDQRWPLLFEVGPEFTDDLANYKLSERWINEFKKRQIELKDKSYITPREQGWIIRPDTQYKNPIFWLRMRERRVEVFDAAMRPNMVAVVELIGPRAVPILKELLTEKDGVLDEAVLQALGKIATPEAVDLLSRYLLLPHHERSYHAAIEALAETRSKQAIQPLIETLRTAGPAREFSWAVGHAIGLLNEVPSLIHFAHEAGMRGDEHSKFATVSALCNCGHKDSAIEELLLKAANDPEPRVRRKAEERLIILRSPKIEERLLNACLEDVDQGAREEAAKALRYFQGDASVLKLIAVLENPGDEIRVRAAEALALIEDDTAIAALVSLLEANHVLVRIAAAKALNTLGFNQVDRLIQVLCPLARNTSDVKARQEAAKALREIPGGKDKLYQPIQEALKGGHYEEVIRLIGSDTPFLPDDANLYWWRGQVRHRLERPQDALSDLDNAIAMLDCPALVHTIRAHVLSDLNRLPEALAAAEKAAEIEPEDADNHFLVGWLAYRANELTKSVAAGRRTVELDPKLATAEFNLGLALLASGQSTEDIDAYNRGIVMCTELDQETALMNFDAASADLDALIMERPQLTAGAEEAKRRLKQAREDRVHPSH